jgi:hypothetical protein
VNEQSIEKVYDWHNSLLRILKFKKKKQQHRVQDVQEFCFCFTSDCSETTHYMLVSECPLLHELSEREQQELRGTWRVRKGASITDLSGTV